MGWTDVIVVADVLFVVRVGEVLDFVTVRWGNSIQEREGKEGGEYDSI